MVILVLVKHLIKRSNSKYLIKRSNKYTTIQLMANITGISCLLGLTWVFGALTVTKAEQAFQIVFTVTNTLQGFFIFIFYCLLNGDVRLAWTQKLLGKRPTTKSTSSMKEGSRSTQLSLKLPSSTESILSHDRVIIEQSETFPTQVAIEDGYIDASTGGSLVQLTCTFSRHKNNMAEQVELNSTNSSNTAAL